MTSPMVPSNRSSPLRRSELHRTHGCVGDQTSQALAFLDENIARTRILGGPPPLGLHPVLGPTFKKIIAVTRRNFAEVRLAPAVIYTRKN